MKDFLFLIPITVLYLAIKSSILSWLPIDLLLVVAIHLSMTRPTAMGVTLVFVLGYMEDAFFGSHVGTSSICLLLTYLTIYLFSNKLQIRGANSQTLLVLAYSLASGFLNYYILLGSNEPSFIYKAILPTALLTGLCAPFIITALDRIDERFELNKFKGTFH